MQRLLPRLPRRLLATSSTITYPAAPPVGRHSGRLMDPAIWPRISPIWPSSTPFPHDPATLHEEDDVRKMAVADARSLGQRPTLDTHGFQLFDSCLLYTSPSPRDKRQSRMPSSA